MPFAWGCPSPKSDPSRKIVDVRSTGGQPTEDACGHSDRRRSPVSRLRAEGPAPRASRPAPSAGRARSFGSTVSALGSSALGVLAAVVAAVEGGAGAGPTGDGARWHRDGLRQCWRRRAGRRPGRPRIKAELRGLIQRMARENGLWGAPRIHGELLKLGMVVSERTVSRYLPDRRTLPWQTWRTFLANHLAMASTSTSANAPGDNEVVEAGDVLRRNSAIRGLGLTRFNVGICMPPCS